VSFSAVIKPRLLGGLVAVALLAAACAPAGGRAAEAVSLHASFSPNRLGASTTIGFGFHIVNTEGGLPAPLTHIDLRMPAGMNYLTSQLGVDSCDPAKLVAHGLSGCSPNARLGFGDAFVEVPFGQATGHEIPNIQALMGPPHNGNVVVLFYADGRAPVYAQLVFQAELLPPAGVFGEDLSTAIPLIPSVTNGPPVSIISVNSTIGPRHLTYYKRVHGRTVPYRPEGVQVPSKCPKGGFKFVADFTFLDGFKTTTKTAIPCPPRRRRHK
jgi:hypothetical protein